MTKVNTKTLIASRDAMPSALVGLSAETLRNLQTALNPVPSEFKDIEFWDEVDETSPYDATTQTLDGTETLTCNVQTKTVTVVRGIRAKTQEELEAERKALVPSQITPRQCRLQLLSLGLLDEVEASLATDKAMSIWFEYSLDFQRNHEMIIAMASQLGMSDVDMDNFFIEASKL